MPVHTPTLTPSGGCETYLNSFKTTYTTHQGNTIALELPTSPEFALKKILVEGASQVFHISRAFRNCGELSTWHEPEFTMLEWYHVGSSLNQILRETQDFVLCLADFLGSHLELPSCWPFFKVQNLFLDILNLNLDELQSTTDFLSASRHLSPSLRETDSWDDIFCKLFMEKIEPFLKLQKACFVTHYPAQMAALAAPLFDANGVPTNYVQRGEAYLYGVEICNAYLELTQSQIFKERIEKTHRLRPNMARDLLFENAMAFGLPPSAGNALGLDRVVALLLGKEQIASLYPLPFLSQFPTETFNQE
jgi:lysyl-tRNA synthetase class 2